MIRHVVVFKFRPGATENQRREALDRLGALGPKIPEVREWSVGLHIDTGRKAWDMAQVSAFANFAALDRYRVHPEHVAVRDFLAQVADWAVVDYEFEPAGDAQHAR